METTIILVLLVVVVVVVFLILNVLIIYIGRICCFMWRYNWTFERKSLFGNWLSEYC